MRLATCHATPHLRLRHKMSASQSQSVTGKVDKPVDTPAFWPQVLSAIFMFFLKATLKPSCAAMAADSDGHKQSPGLGMKYDEPEAAVLLVACAIGLATGAALLAAEH